MIKVIYSIFHSSRTIKVAEHLVEQLFSRDDWQPPLHATNPLPELKKTVLTEIKQCEVDQIEDDPNQIENFVLQLIVDVIRSRLESGQYQLYGEHLTDDGNELLRVLRLATELMVHKEYIQQLPDFLSIYSEQRV